MTRRLRYIFRFSAIFGILALVCSCSSVVNLNANLKEYNVNLYLKEYTPNFSVANPNTKAKDVPGQHPQRRAQHNEFFLLQQRQPGSVPCCPTAPTHVQLVPSFFWYAYQKAFEYAGIETLARCESRHSGKCGLFLSRLTRMS